MKRFVLLALLACLSLPVAKAQADWFYWEQANEYGHHFGENAAIVEAKAKGRTAIQNRVKPPKTIERFEYDVLNTGVMMTTEDGDLWFAYVRTWALVRVPDGGPEQPVPPKPVIE